MKLKLFLLLVSVLGFFVSWAQEEPVSGKDGAFIRFWNMSSRSNEFLDLICENQPEFSVQSAGKYYTGYYTPIKPGKYNFKILKNKNEMLSDVSLNMKQGDYFTIATWLSDKNVKAKAVYDTYDIKNQKTGNLTIRNFMPGLEANASIVGKHDGITIPFGEFYQFSNLPLKNNTVNLKLKLPSGSSASMNQVINFDDTKRISMLLITDIYGDFYPKVVFDGWVYEPTDLDQALTNQVNF